MDSFDKPYWSRLQVELWVCTRSRDAVRMAAQAPGSIQLADLSLGPDGADDDRLDDDPLIFDDDAELIGMAIIKYGWVCSYDDARQQVIVASTKELRAYPDPEAGDPHGEFFERAAVLALWPEKVVAEVLDAAAPPGRPVAKRRGGRPAPWVKHLRRYLQLRLKSGQNLLSMSLAELRRDFSSYATQQQIKIPKARSSLDNQISKVRQELATEHQERAQREGAAAPPIDELVGVPEIRRK